MRGQPRRRTHGDDAGEIRKRDAIGALLSVDPGWISGHAYILLESALRPAGFLGNRPRDPDRELLVAGQRDDALDRRMPIDVVVGSVAIETPPGARWEAP